MQSTVHDYWSIWKQFVLQGVLQEEVLPPALMQSWRRCAARELNPYGEGEARSGIEPVQVSLSQKVLTLVRPAMEDLHQFAEGAECVMVFADADVRVVDVVGDRTMQEELEHLGLIIGASWGEEQQGANALALALQESFP